jgi:metal-dependent amidase/aminoacylase/carboxypeptidase family protein
MHVACLIGATSLFAHSRDSWHGTLMAVFQPGEETAQGAQAMMTTTSSNDSQNQMLCLASMS